MAKRPAPAREGPPESLREREAQDPRGPGAKFDGIVIGELAGFGERGEPLVDFPGNPARSAVPARCVAPLGPAAVGSEVALLFEGGDPARPIALGPVRDRWQPASPQPLELQPEPLATPLASPFELQSDGERVELRARRELTLRVGKASITLTAAGKVLIRGAYVLSRSSGVNRIKGGSVQLN